MTYPDFPPGYLDGANSPAPNPYPSALAPPPDPNEALRRQIMDLLAPQHPDFAQKVGKLDVPWSNTPRPSAASYLLRGLVSGFNSKAEPDVKQARLAETLLRLNQSGSYQQGQLGLRAGALADTQTRTGLIAENQNPDAKGSKAWGTVQGMDERQARDHVLNQVALDADSRGNHSLADRIRHELVGEGQARVDEAGRNTRHATPSGTSIANGGATGGKGASPFTADNAYYRNLGEQMIAADKKQTGGQNEQSIRSWMNAQLRDLGTVEGNRRRARQGAAAPTGAPSTLDLLNRP